MRKRRIAALIITLACSILFAQCERNDLYINSDNALSLIGLDFLLPPSQVNVQTGGVDYPNGSIYNFGTITQGSSSTAVVFTIQNIGTENITLLGVSIGSADPADFPTTNPGTILMISGDTVTFNAAFFPSAVGVRSAVVTIDTDAGSCSIILHGTGTVVPVPDIDVRYSGTSYASGDLYTFAGVPVGGSSGVLTFTIENTGMSDLTINSLSVGGINPSEFSVSGPALSTVPGGTNTTFTVTFNPAAAGTRSAELMVSSDDPDEEPYTVYLEGEGTVPTINLLITGTSYSSGATYDFGEGLIKGSSTPVTFTIENLGTGSLTLTGSPYVIGGGTSVGDLSISGPSLGTIAPGGSTTFIVGFTPSTEGACTANITIPSNDPALPLYTISLTATGVMPVMVVNGNNSNYTSIYNPITNTFTTGNPVAGNVGRGGHSFFIPTGYGYTYERYHLVLHGNVSTANSLYNPSSQVFTLHSNTVTNNVGSDAHSFPVTGGTNAGSFLIVSGTNSTLTTYFNPSTNQFSNGPAIVASGNVSYGSFHLPRTGGDILVVCGNGTSYTSVFSQSGNSFSIGPNIAPTANVASGGHGFLITGGSYDGFMLVIPGGGFNYTRFYNPATATFALGPTLSAIASTGAFSIPIASGTNAGRALIVHGNNTTLASVYNMDGTIVSGPSFTDGDIGIGAFSFLITGGAYRGMFMIIHGGTVTVGVGTTITTIFDPETLTFITGTGDNLPNQAGAGAHCFPAR